MGVKQRNHFAPMIVKWWGLEAVAPLVRQLVEELNLYSVHRGRNRFPILVMLFDRMAASDEARKIGLKLPDVGALRRYCDSGQPLGSETLAAEAERTRDPELARFAAWSRALNADIDAHMAPVPPFAWARRALERMAQGSDLLVVSQTPKPALFKEWRLHGVAALVGGIAGQEDGSKSEQLSQGNGGRYAAGRVMMIGDALGDLETARACDAHFYPIVPGKEEHSWQLLHDEAYARFLAGTYGGDYARERIAEFARVLGAKV
jgi:phosphoglycolate phosphatase-like HAD superfamily hydrolase